MSYNLLAGFGIAGGLLGIAAGVEALLIGVGVYGLWTTRQRSR